MANKSDGSPRPLGVGGVTKFRKKKNDFIVEAWQAVFDGVFIFLGLLILIFNGFPAIANLDSLNKQQWIVFCLGWVFFYRISERLEQLWNWIKQRNEQEDDEDD
jgi:hypothetical protein